MRKLNITENVAEVDISGGDSYTSNPRGGNLGMLNKDDDDDDFSNALNKARNYIYLTLERTKLLRWGGGGEINKTGKNRNFRKEQKKNNAMQFLLNTPQSYPVNSKPLSIKTLVCTFAGSTITSPRRVPCVIMDLAGWQRLWNWKNTNNLLTFFCFPSINWQHTMAYLTIIIHWTGSEYLMNIHHPDIYWAWGK